MKEGARKGGSEEEREGGSEEGREGGSEEGREGGREGGTSTWIDKPTGQMGERGVEKVHVIRFHFLLASGSKPT